VLNLEGEDITLVLKENDRFKVIKRTTGISTTDITGRLLALLDEEDKDEDVKINIKPRVPPQC